VGEGKGAGVGAGAGAATTTHLTSGHRAVHRSSRCDDRGPQNKKPLAGHLQVNNLTQAAIVQQV
jgi:hypothetical protein